MSSQLLVLAVVSIAIVVIDVHAFNCLDAAAPYSEQKGIDKGKVDNLKEKICNEQFNEKWCVSEKVGAEIKFKCADGNAALYCQKSTACCDATNGNCKTVLSNLYTTTQAPTTVTTTLSPVTCEPTTPCPTATTIQCPVCIDSPSTISNIESESTTAPTTTDGTFPIHTTTITPILTTSITTNTEPAATSPTIIKNTTPSAGKSSDCSESSTAWMVIAVVIIVLFVITLVLAIVLGVFWWRVKKENAALWATELKKPMAMVHSDERQIKVKAVTELATELTAREDLSKAIADKPVEEVA